MRDDIGKLGLPASARRYARLTSKDKDAYGPAKVNLYVQAQGDLSHQSAKGFPHSSGGHSLGKAVKGAKSGFPDIAGTDPVPHAMKEGEEWSDGSWQYQLFAEYHGRPAVDDDEVAIWLSDMMELRREADPSRIPYNSLSLKEWLQNRLIIQRAMAESIVDVLLGEAFVAWHSSPERFRTFRTEREGAHFGTREQADNLRKPGKRPAKPYVLNIQNPLRIRDMGVWHPDAIAAELLREDVITQAEYDAFRGEYEWTDERGFAKLKEILAAKGYDGFVYANEQEGEGDSYVAFYSHQIRPYQGH